MFKPDTITVYTDGASRGNPGRGGWGCIVVFGNEKVIELGGKQDTTTNNQMELQGAIEGLKIVLTANDGDFKKVHVHSDSQYVLNGITSWIKNWKKNNWKTAAKKSVLNQELWQELDALVQKIESEDIKIDWTYVKGHSDNKFNERADVIATECADSSMKSGGSKTFYNGEKEKWGY
jgi:ribonuclease HI